VTDALTPERILQATEDVLRRYGPSKATVVDVARVLGVSHGSVYRHFRTKSALRAAVTQRWLDRTNEQLGDIASDPGPAEQRLDRWLTGLFEAKRRKAGDDPELFATYSVLAGEADAVVDQHIQDLTGQLARIIEDGRTQSVFVSSSASGSGSASGSVGSPAEVARAVFQATARFHDPSYAAVWSQPGTDEEFAALRSLLLRGLRA